MSQCSCNSMDSHNNFCNRCNRYIIIDNRINIPGNTIFSGHSGYSGYSGWLYPRSKYEWFRLWLIIVIIIILIFFIISYHNSRLLCESDLPCVTFRESTGGTDRFLNRNVNTMLENMTDKEMALIPPSYIPFITDIGEDDV